MPLYVLVLLLFASTAFTTPAAAESDIWSAAREGDLNRVKALLESGVDVNAQTRYQATPLYFAAGYGHAELVDYLLEHGADPGIRDAFLSRSPLSRAINGKHADAAIRLIEHGVVDTMHSTLADSVQQQLPTVVAAIVDRGPVFDFEKNAALAAARETNSAELIELISKAEVRTTLPTVELEAKTLESLAGLYRSRSDEVAEVEIHEGKVRIRQAEGEPIQLDALSPFHFRSLTDHDRGAYFIGRLGIVEWLTVTTGAESVTYRRFMPDPTEPVTDSSLADSSLADSSSKDSSSKGSSSTNRAATAIETAVTPRRAPIHWPSFRGQGASGLGDGQGVPSVWDIEDGTNVLWKTKIPGLAHSSAAVWGDRVFVTTAISEAGEPVSGSPQGSFAGHEGDDTAVHTWKTYALDKATGKIVWQHDAATAVPLTGRHLTSSHANSTPATDGRHVVVVFPTAGMLCYTMDGKLLWRKDLGGLNAGNYVDASIHWGFASSPVLDDGKLILQADVHEGAFLAAYDVTTGRELWKTPRDEVSSWATPLVYRDAEHAEIVTNGPTIRGYNLNTGQELWHLRPNSEQVVPAPITAHGLIYVTTGYPPAFPIYAVRPGQRGDLSLQDGATSSEAIAWSHARGGAYMITPIVYDELFYLPANGGRLTAYDAMTGERVYRARLSQSGNFTASPVAADGRLFLPTNNGLVYVIKTGRTYRELAINDMQEGLTATPSIADGALYIRTRNHLYALGSNAE